MLNKKNIQINTKIGEKLLGSLIELGKHQFSSNVIEKCLEDNSDHIKQEMVKEMLTDDKYIDFLKD